MIEYKMKKYKVSPTADVIIVLSKHTNIYIVLKMTLTSKREMPVTRKSYDIKYARTLY